MQQSFLCVYGDTCLWPCSTVAFSFYSISQPKIALHTRFSCEYHKIRDKTSTWRRLRFYHVSLCHVFNIQILFKMLSLGTWYATDNELKPLFHSWGWLCACHCHDELMSQPTFPVRELQVGTLANAAGVGGGAIYVPLFNIFIGFGECFCPFWFP